MKLIVNADDLGYTAGVTRGILRAHERGIVTAATLMVNTPEAAGAAALAREAPSLDVGLHLVFTHGRALSDPTRIPSLVAGDGAFPRPAELLRERHLSADEAVEEARVQWERACLLLGRAPTHVDTHHWVHDHPALEEAVAAVGRETGAAVRAHTPGQRARLRAGGVRTTDAFTRAFQHAGHIGVDELVDLLARLATTAGTVELMCHPGEVDAALRGRSTYADERATELATLTDRRVREAVARLGIELTDFRSW